LFAVLRIVLLFCIAGLLFIVPRARSNIGSVSHPAGDRPSLVYRKADGFIVGEVRSRNKSRESLPRLISGVECKLMECF